MADDDLAQNRIWIATYILSGKVKIELIKKLNAAHERGVEVRLLVDRIGSGLVINSADFNALPFYTAIFHNSLFRSFFYMEKRLHSKIIVIDDDDAFIGAHNLRDEVLEVNQNFVKNISLRFSGSVVKQLDAVFAGNHQTDDLIDSGYLLK